MLTYPRRVVGIPTELTIATFEALPPAMRADITNQLSLRDIANLARASSTWQAAMQPELGRYPPDHRIHDSWDMVRVCTRYTQKDSSGEKLNVAEILRYQYALKVLSDAIKDYENDSPPTYNVPRKVVEALKVKLVCLSMSRINTLEFLLEAERQ